MVADLRHALVDMFHSTPTRAPFSATERRPARSADPGESRRRQAVVLVGADSFA
jgi:hypothetical protein